jgi:hypothetical protein
MQNIDYLLGSNDFHSANEFLVNSVLFGYRFPRHDGQLR